MSETTEETPQFFQFRGAYGQVRMVNRYPTFRMRSPWIACGVKYNAVLSSDECHPADIQHLLQATTPVRVMRDGRIVREEQPLLVPIDAPA